MTAYSAFLPFNQRFPKVYIYNEDGPIGNTGVYEPDTSNEVTLANVGNKDITIADAVDVTLKALDDAVGDGSTIPDGMTLTWKLADGTEYKGDAQKTVTIAKGTDITAIVTITGSGFETGNSSGGDASELAFGATSSGDATATTGSGKDYGSWGGSNNAITYTFEDAIDVPASGEQSAKITCAWTVAKTTALSVVFTVGAPGS